VVNSYNSYNMGQYPNNFQNYDNFNSKPLIFAPTVGSAAVGFVGGSVASVGMDLVRNRRPVIKGEVSDSFAKQVMNKNIDKGYAVKNKEFFYQKNELLKKLCKVKSPEEFIKLLKKYQKYASELYEGMSFDSMCKTVTKDNVKGKVSALKNKIEASIEPEIRNIKDTINLCWDKEAKKFVKPKNVEDKIFKVIKNTKNNIQWKKMLKYGGVTAGVFGAITLIYYMLINKSGAASKLENNVQNYV